MQLTGVSVEVVGNAKSFAILLIAPFISILPDLTLKQLWYNLYPTPTQLIEIHRRSPELLRILGSESKFMKNLSSFKNDFSQKIELVNIEENGKLFEKRKSRIQESMRLEFMKNSNYENITGNIYGAEETTKSPLKPIDTQNNLLIEYINKQENKNYVNISDNKKIEELHSAEINSILFFERDIFFYYLIGLNISIKALMGKAERVAGIV